MSLQLLAIPGGCKGIDGDVRVLDMDDRSQARRFTAQGLTGEETELHFTDQPGFTQAKALNHLEIEHMWQKGLPYLKAAGFINPQPVGRRTLSISFSAENRSSQNPCPLCSRVHDR